MPRTLKIFALLLLLALISAPFTPRAQVAPEAPGFPWLSHFDDGQYIGDIFPAGIVETDFASVSNALSGKHVNVVILDAGGANFASVAIGLYDEEKHDVAPLWTLAQLDGLPHAIENLSFDGLFIKYDYLPGDKYVSCNFKLASGGKASLKAFQVTQDMDYIGVSLKADDFIMASDSGGGGALSLLGNGDYNDLVFVLKLPQEGPLPITQAILGVGGCGLIGLTLWSFRRGQKGLE